MATKKGQGKIGHCKMKEFATKMKTTLVQCQIRKCNVPSFIEQTDQDMVRQVVMGEIYYGMADNLLQGILKEVLI